MEIEWLKYRGVECRQEACFQASLGSGGAVTSAIAFGGGGEQDTGIAGSMVYGAAAMESCEDEEILEDVSSQDTESSAEKDKMVQLRREAHATRPKFEQQATKRWVEVGYLRVCALADEPLDGWQNIRSRF